MKKKILFLFYLISFLIITSSSGRFILYAYNNDTTQEISIINSADDYNIVEAEYIYSNNATRPSAVNTNFLKFNNSFDTIDSIMESINNDVSINSVIGGDELRKVLDTTISPYKYVCKLQTKNYGMVKNSDGKTYTLIGSGTAFFVGENILLTAAHCIYGDPTTGDFDDGEFNPVFDDDIKIIPGYYVEDGIESFPYGTINVKKAYIPKEYYDYSVENYNVICGNYDWAILVIDDFSSSDYFPRKTNYNITDKIGYVIGYPGGYDGSMYFSQGNFLSSSEYKYSYNMDTTGGSSGSPILVRENSNWIAIGIHTTGGSSSNSGTIINEFINALIDALVLREQVQLRNYYTENNTIVHYNCLVEIIVVPGDNESVMLSSDYITFPKTINEKTHLFYSSSTSSLIGQIPYNYYKTYNLVSNEYSNVTDFKALYDASNYSSKYKIVGRTYVGDTISTTFGQEDNIWSHNSSSGKIIKGTIAYNNYAKNIEVQIPASGTNLSNIVTLNGIEFQIRADATNISIKANSLVTCTSNSVVFAFGIG